MRDSQFVILGVTIGLWLGLVAAGGGMKARKYALLSIISAVVGVILRVTWLA